MILRHQAKRTILLGRMLSRIMAIHGKRAPNYGAIEDARTSTNVGNLSPVLQVSGSSRLEKCRPERITPRESTLNPREPATHGQNEIARGPFQQVFALCDTKAAGKTCPAIKGILEEGAEDMKEAADADVLDAGMIADAQAVEHYEIARYGTLIAWANQLGMKEAATLLNQTLEQEYNADRTLTELAETSLNRQAAA